VAMKHVLIISFGLLAVATALIDVAGPGRSAQVITSSVGALMGLIGIGFIVFEMSKNGLSAIRLFESLLFGMAIILGLISIAEAVKLI